MYDSTEDTKKHIAQVVWYMALAMGNLRKRALVHDDSKLHEPEKSAWDEATPKLADLTYGSEEYKAALRAIKPAVQHHYQHNSHHPEYWENGIKDMTLLDLLEMLCDWKAASERTKDGDLLSSLDQNQERFGYSDELASILRNTAKELF